MTDKAGNGEQLRQYTVYLTTGSLALGYVILSGILGWGYGIDIPLLSSERNGFFFLFVIIWNLLILSFLGIMTYRHPNRWLYYLYLFVCIGSAIPSLHYFISITGGVFHSPFTGFYGMLFSTLVLIASTWATERSWKAVAYILFCFLFASASIVSRSLGDPLVPGQPPPDTLNTRLFLATVLVVGILATLILALLRPRPSSGVLQPKSADA